MQEEVTQKTVTFCIRATKITANLLKKVLVAYLRHQKQKSVEKKAQKNQPKQGKVTVKELAKQNAGMVNIEITDKNIKSFERYARKYGINYALKKDKSKEPAAMDIGSYQGFNMRIQFDSWSKEFILSVKHESVAKVRLGADALGNITRINNLLESYPEKLAEAEQRLETVQEQMANAKEEVGKPFPKEAELNHMLERLSELNALLNMDEREDKEAEMSETAENEEKSVHGSIHEKLQIYKEKSQRESSSGRNDRKQDLGLE